MNKPVFLILLAAMLGGCAASTTPNYDARFGDAVREARQRMTINPAAAPDVAAGMDGMAAQNALLQYQKSFEKPPEPVTVINIGGSASGSGR